MRKKHSIWMLLANIVVFLIVTRLIMDHYVSFDQIVALAGQFYASYGPLFLFLAGLTEAIILIGLYLPGSTVILLGAALAGTRVISLPEVIIWSTLGLSLGYSLSYAIGRLGWEKILAKFDLLDSVKNAKNKAEKSKFIYVWSTFHPNVAAIASVAMGIMRVNFFSFFISITLCQLFWSTFWGLIFYYFGPTLIKKVVVVCLVALACLIIIKLIQRYNLLRFLGVAQDKPR